MNVMILHIIIGVILTIIMVLGFSENITVIYTFFVKKELRSKIHILVIGLALSDLCQSVCGVPLVVLSSFHGTWIFGEHACQYYAFVTTSCGISQIALLSLIAMERYFIVVKQNHVLSQSYQRCIVVILCSFAYGSASSLGPLLGWSSYQLEPFGTACSVSWQIHNMNALSYTIFLFTLGWFVPLFVIAYGYINIALLIYRERNRRKRLQTQMSKNVNRDRKVALTIFMMIGAFNVSWLPYSVVSLWSAFGDFERIPSWALVAPAIFAKCSIIWNPIVYVARHTHFRNAIVENLRSVFFLNRLWIEKQRRHSDETGIRQTFLDQTFTERRLTLVCPIDSHHETKYISRKTTEISLNDFDPDTFDKKIQTDPLIKEI